MRLGRGERFALLAVRRVFDVLAGTPIHAYVKLMEDTLIRSLSDKDRDELEAAARARNRTSGARAARARGGPQRP